MRSSLLLLVSLFVVFSLTRAEEDEKAKKVADQKKAALANWALLEVGEPATLESEHFFVVAPAGQEKKLKALSATLTRYHASAMKTLALDPKDAYPGKITIYILPEESDFPSFSRRVEKRRPERGATASFMAEDDRLHAAAPSEQLVGEMVASLLMQRKAGLRSPLPDWLLYGFGRATTYRLSPREKAVLIEKQKVRGLARKISGDAIWDDKVDPEDAPALRGSLVEYLAFVGGASRFPKMVTAFKPGENGQSRSVEYVFKEAGISGDKVKNLWKSWAAR